MTDRRNKSRALLSVVSVMAFVALMALFYVRNPSREETAAQAMSSPPEFRAPDGWYLPTAPPQGP